MAETGTVCVREVTCAPEPIAVTATDQQFLGLERFCTNPYNFCVAGIYPTFNLGCFTVTATVYRHLLVEDTRSHTSSIMPGPNLVQQCNLFRSYNYFLLTLVGLKPNLANVLACWNKWQAKRSGCSCTPVQLSCSFSSYMSTTYLESLIKRGTILHTSAPND